MICIEDGVKIIGFFMIGFSCLICQGVVVDNSVIFEYFCLGFGVCLVDKLVFGCYCVDKIGVAIDVQVVVLDWFIIDVCYVVV